ncbi:MAG TPA: deoxyribodipyrimidine photo-lyase, partial [Mycobacteriales bacterium]|nr:deoxyribodipyrimidine photo-lyase [Mycobacteriales bacterium]
MHAAARSAEFVVPLFVVDAAITGLPFNRPNPAAFLAQSLSDLDASLRSRGAALVIRRGDVAREVARLAASLDAAAVHISADYSRYAVRREQRLAAALGRRELVVHDAHVIAPPGSVTTGDGRPFSVFTPYHRKWQHHHPRSVLPAPRRLTLPEGLATGRLPDAADLCRGARSPDVAAGGETAGRKRMSPWLARHLAGYDDGHDDLAADVTSRLSPYLHFGCVSPVELASKVDRRRRGADAFLRQLAWRDFFHQVLADRPEVVDADWRTKHDRWRTDDAAFEAWREGRTGYPLVDAGMRQLAREGWMHNRSRLVTASFLTKHLYLDWRLGARHFFDLLVDGDIANNTLNWQWVAGTGTDSRPNR